MNDFGNISEYSNERNRIIQYAKFLRSLKENQRTDWLEAAEWHMKYSYLNGKKSLALTVTLSPVGCQWAKNGGCTMCGEFEGADQCSRILENPQFHIAQFIRAITNPEIWNTAKSENVPITWLRIFQEGNYLNPEEMNPYAQETILRMATLVKGIKRITIESRPQFINEKTVTMLNQIFSDTNVELEIGMGVEAVNDVVRNICINKGDSINDFQRVAKLLNDNNIKPLAYIIVKPPFLSEKESIEEAVSTAIYATQIGFKRISFEPMSIHSYSLVDALYQSGTYKVPWLWTVVEIAKKCAKSGVVDFGIGGIGFYPLPTTFSHNYCTNNSSYSNCNEKVVKAIIDFNKTHNINCLNNIEPCIYCYNTWETMCNSQINKSLKERINEQLDIIDNSIKEYTPRQISEGDNIKTQTLIASGSQTNSILNNNYYNWLNNEYNEPDLNGIGFTQLVSSKPLIVKDNKTIVENNRIIRDFQSICLDLLKVALKNNDRELLKWLVNDTPQSMGEDYLRKLPSVFWKQPVFFRTDESSEGKIFEIQCPGSSWGELELLYNFYRKLGVDLQLCKPSQNFTNQLVEHLSLKNGESPLVFYLTDNASIPVGVRYFISQTRFTNPPIKYWGIDKYPKIEIADDSGKTKFKQLKAIDSHFIRSHYYLEILGECDFSKRIHTHTVQSPYDLPPISLFDQKVILALPFWDKTKEYFSDDIRNLLAYTIPLVDSKIRLENGNMISIENFASLPQSQRKYYLKYAGTDASFNWGSRSVTSIERIGHNALLELLYEKINDYKNNGRPWILQAESKGKKEIIKYYNPVSCCEIEEKNLNSKYSYFYGPYAPLGGIASYRKNNIVHGQPDTIIKLIDFYIEHNSKK